MKYYLTKNEFTILKGLDEIIHLSKSGIKHKQMKKVISQIKEILNEMKLDDSQHDFVNFEKLEIRGD